VKTGIMKHVLPLALALTTITAGLALAQPQPQYQYQQPQQQQQATYPPQYPAQAQQQQYPQQYTSAYPPQPQKNHLDMDAIMSAMDTAMKGIKKLNEVNKLPPELQNTEQARAAKQAAIMMTSTAIAAAIGSAVVKDHAKGAMIGAAVGGVAAMIIEEAKNNKPRPVAPYGPVGPTVDNRPRSQ
jgi:hypothetical protein